MHCRLRQVPESSMGVVSCLSCLLVPELMSHNSPDIAVTVRAPNGHPDKLQPEPGRYARAVSFIRLFDGVAPDPPLTRPPAASAPPQEQCCDRCHNRPGE